MPQLHLSHAHLLLRQHLLKVVVLSEEMFVTVAGVDELLVEVVEICASLLDLVEHLSGLDRQLFGLVAALS